MTIPDWVYSVGTVLVLMWMAYSTGEHRAEMRELNRRAQRLYDKMDAEE